MSVCFHCTEKRRYVISVLIWLQGTGKGLVHPLLLAVLPPEQHRTRGCNGKGLLDAAESSMRVPFSSCADTIHMRWR